MMKWGLFLTHINQSCFRLDVGQQKIRNDKWQMRKTVKWEMRNDKWEMTNDKWEMRREEGIEEIFWFNGIVICSTSWCNMEGVTLWQKKEIYLVMKQIYRMMEQSLSEDGTNFIWWWSNLYLNDENERLLSYIIKVYIIKVYI